VNDVSKAAPEPLDPSDLMATALTRAAAGEGIDDLAIDFRVAGGAPGQRYKLVLTTAGQRLERCSVECALSGRRTASDDKEAGEQIVSALAERLLASELLSIREPTPKFLPDTLIGIITLSVGGLERRFYFAADPDQASVQGLTTPRALLAAADTLYDTAAQVLGMENVRP
jgi:hypothetical protein